MATTLDPHLRWLITLALTAGAGACAKETPETEPPDASPPQSEGTEEPQTPSPGGERAPEEPPGEPQAETDPNATGDECGTLVDGLRPASAVDGVVLIKDTSKLAGSSDGGSTLQQTRAGAPCKTATNAQACEAALSEPPKEALRADCGQLGCVTTVLAYTAGDRVGWVTSPEELRAFLGPIDTAAEARLVAWREGYSAGCGVKTVDGGFTLPATMMVSDCPITNGTYVLKVASDGTLTKLEETLEETTACVGRLPPGLMSLPPAPEDLSASEAVADWLARVAHLEASAVHAFACLARELEHHGAPATLIAAAREAQADEVRHAERVGALAHRLGGEVAPVELDEIAKSAVRSPEELALDNAVEGLVRETWGAVVGAWQAEHAELAEVRSMMAEIAADELRHAEFSRALHTWLKKKIDPASLDRVENARAEAWQRTLASVRPANSTSRALGVPTGAVAEAMLAVIAMDGEERRGRAEAQC